MKKDASFLKRKRYEKMMTLHEVSEKAGISIRYVNIIENNDRDSVPYETLLRVAQALDIDIDVVMVNVGRLPASFFFARKDKPEELTQELLSALKKFERKHYEISGEKPSKLEKEDE